MSMYDELGHWDHYDDDRQNDPVVEEFDRVIHTTKKAVLYGIGEYQFWLPKSVHQVETRPSEVSPGTLLIEGWATYYKTKEPDIIVDDADEEI